MKATALLKSEAELNMVVLGNNASASSKAKLLLLLGRTGEQKRATYICTQPCATWQQRGRHCFTLSGFSTFDSHGHIFAISMGAVTVGSLEKRIISSRMSVQNCPTACTIVDMQVTTISLPQRIFVLSDTCQLRGHNGTLWARPMIKVERTWLTASPARC